MDKLPEYVDGIPNICGSEVVVDTAIKAAQKGPVFLREDSVPFGGMRSAFAIALHMHQPLIPAGGADLGTARLVSNLKYMMDNPGIGTTTMPRYSLGATSAWVNSSPS